MDKGKCLAPRSPCPPAGGCGRQDFSASVSLPRDFSLLAGEGSVLSSNEPPSGSVEITGEGALNASVAQNQKAPDLEEEALYADRW